jgi:hypothetical protein
MAAGILGIRGSLRLYSSSYHFQNLLCSKSEAHAQHSIKKVSSLKENAKMLGIRFMKSLAQEIGTLSEGSRSRSRGLSNRMKSPNPILEDPLLVFKRIWQLARNVQLDTAI